MTFFITGHNLFWKWKQTVNFTQIWPGDICQSLKPKDHISQQNNHDKSSAFFHQVCMDLFSEITNTNFVWFYFCSIWDNEMIPFLSKWPSFQIYDLCRIYVQLLWALPIPLQKVRVQVLWPFPHQIEEEKNAASVASKQKDPH